MHESSSRFKNFDFFKCILRDSIRHPRLDVKLGHANPSIFKSWFVMKVIIFCDFHNPPLQELFNF